VATAAPAAPAAAAAAAAATEAPAVSFTEFYRVLPSFILFQIVMNSNKNINFPYSIRIDSLICRRWLWRLRRRRRRLRRLRR